MLDVLTAVLPLYALIVLGLIASRSAAFRDASGPLNAYVYWFALPAFLFMAVAGAPDGAGLPWTFLAVALVVTLGFSAAMFGVARLLGWRDVAGLVSLAAGYGNVGYVAFPVILGVLGPQASLPMALAATVHNLIFLLGYPLMQSLGAREPGQLRRALLRAGPLNPTILSVVLGGLVLWSGWEPPALLLAPIELVSGSVIPVALFTIGLVLGPAIRMLLDGKGARGPVLLASATKLLVLPLLTWGAAVALVPDPTGLLIPILVLLAAMPTGAATFTLSREFDGDARLVAAVVALSTLVSLLTVPAFGALVLGG